MFSGLESPWHLLIVLVIAIVIFGPKKLPELGHSLGSGIRGFKHALEGKEEDIPASGTVEPPPVQPVVAQTKSDDVSASSDQAAR